MTLVLAVEDDPSILRGLSDNLTFEGYEVITATDGEPVEMTRKEFEILRYLASREGEVVSRDDLLNEVWGYESYPTSRTVDNHVAALRAKLERHAGEPQHLKTVHRVGYKFVR